MSANVKSMMYVGEKPWHGLGKKLEGKPTLVEAIEAAGLNWEVVGKPVYQQLVDGNFREVENRQLIVRSDTEEVLGDVGTRFTPLQNLDAFKGIDEAVRKIGATYETAGCLGNGSRVWILAKLPGQVVVGKRDEINKYILLAHAHDGSLAVREFVTPIRVVCSNTLNASLSLARKDGATIYSRHTSGVADRVISGTNRLLEISGIYDSLGELYGRMLTHRMNKKQVEDYFKKVVKIPTKDEALKPSRVLEELNELAETGKGTNLPGVRGSLWGAYNAITEYVDFGGRRSQLAARANSLLFGVGAKTKINALDEAKVLLKV